MCLSDLSSQNIIGLSSSLSILISQDLSTNEISLLSAFFNTLGDNLAIIATKKSIEDSNS